MLRLLWALSVRIHYYLRRYMPTNIALDAIRTRRGLKLGLPTMLLAGPYLLAASICTHLINDDGPGWLNLLVILFIWNAMKFVVMGPVSLALLMWARSERVRANQVPSARYADRSGNSRDPLGSRST